MLIVEDGTGLPDADSYLSVADASARLVALGMTNFSGLTNVADQEACLRLASRSVDQIAGSNLRGCLIRSDQKRLFPRSGYLIRGLWQPSDQVPEDVLQICALSAEVNSYSYTVADDPMRDPAIKRIRRASRAEVEFHAGVSRHSPAQRSAAAMLSAASDVLRFESPGGLFQ